MAIVMYCSRCATEARDFLEFDSYRLTFSDQIWRSIRADSEKGKIAKRMIQKCDFI